MSGTGDQDQYLFYFLLSHSHIESDVFIQVLHSAHSLLSTRDLSTSDPCFADDYKSK